VSGADTGTGVCSRHGGRPVLSHCVACGRAMCAQCIVRTPVGFKCSACTGGPADPPRPRRRPPVNLNATRLRPASPRTLPLIAAALLVVAVAAFAGYLLVRPSHRIVVTTNPAAVAPANTDRLVQFTGAPGHQISGDLLLPPRSSGAVPGVVIVPDWGSVDRNGMTPVGTLPDPLYSDLAQELLSKGIASLRYDPAGQGQSVLPQGSTLRFEDLVTDADAAVRLMAERVGVDPQRLSVIGHGWGGLVALQLAGQDHRINRLVLVSTPGRPVVDTLADQLQTTAVTPADAQLEIQQLRQAVMGLLAGQPLPQPSALETPLRPILQPGQEPYLKAIFGLDPANLAKQAHVPTFIVRGGQDPAITAADCQLLAGALGAQGQLLTAPNASRTLSITTKTFVPGPTTVPTPNGGMQNVHVPNAVVTISRDGPTLAAIADWIGDTPAPAGG
jgi:pimeloyl-ACP methyl ester carboxylesterase